MRKIDGAADGRGPRGHQRRPDPGRRRRRQRTLAARSQHRDGVSELRALSPFDGRGEHRLRPEGPRRGEGDDRGKGEGRRADARAVGISRQKAGAAFGRSAAARRDGPRHRARAERLSDGRALVQSRCASARPHANRNRSTAKNDRRDHDLRHPRSGRGDDHGRSGGGDEPGRAPAVRAAARALSRAG